MDGRSRARTSENLCERGKLERRDAGTKQLQVAKSIAQLGANSAQSRRTECAEAQTESETSSRRRVFFVRLFARSLVRRRRQQNTFARARRERRRADTSERPQLTRGAQAQAQQLGQRSEEARQLLLLASCSSVLRERFAGWRKQDNKSDIRERVCGGAHRERDKREAPRVVRFGGAPTSEWSRASEQEERAHWCSHSGRRGCALVSCWSSRRRRRRPGIERIPSFWAACETVSRRQQQIIGADFRSHAADGA
jgi:hypothetical protein